MAQKVQTEKGELEYEIRIPKREELQQVIDLANADNWNTTLDILTDIYDLQKDGFRAAVDKNGTVLSHCCMVSLDDKNAFVTSFITRPELRGMGIGKKIWDTCMDAVKGKNIILNARDDKEGMYNRLGFVASETKMQIVDYMFELKRNELVKEVLQVATVVDFTAAMFDKVYNYDSKIQPIERSAFVKNHIAKSDMVKVALQEGEVVGYVCLRKNFKGFLIMPLYADTFDIARQLLHSVTDTLDENVHVKFGIPRGNPKAEEVFRDIGWAPKPYDPLCVRIRMQTSKDRPAKDINEAKVYSIMNYSYVLI